MQETPTNPERKISKEEVLEALRNTGMENADTRELVIIWTEQREQEVQTSRDSVIFNVERIDLYVAAGDIAGAIENLSDALYQAKQENEKELIEEITGKIENLSKGVA